VISDVISLAVLSDTSTLDPIVVSDIDAIFLQEDSELGQIHGLEKDLDVQLQGENKPQRQNSKMRREVCQKRVNALRPEKRRSENLFLKDW